MNTIINYSSRVLVALALSAGMTVTSCYDDSLLKDQYKNLGEQYNELDEKLKDHESRLKELERLTSQQNTNIESLQSIVSALLEKDYVTGVSPIKEGENIIGFVINFEKGDPITIYHGEDGKDGDPGEDGSVPAIGVKQDEADGQWYWTIDGEWLMDSENKKVRASAKDGADGENGSQGESGKDGVTPQLKIENGYWYVSYDNGKTWEEETLGKATGDKGDSMFTTVSYDNDYLYITLADGQTISLKRVSANQVGPVAMELTEVTPHTVTFTGTITDEDIIPYIENVAIYYKNASETFSIMNANKKSTTRINPDNTTSITIPDLANYTTYNYCVYVKSRGVETYSDLQQFTTLQLPSINDFTLAPFASQEISFSAHDTWTIAADKDWLSFDPASGDKGMTTVNCIAANGFTSETAKVTLTFGQGTESVTFNVTRSEKQRSIAFANAAGLPLFSLEFGESSKTTTFNVTANFNWELDTEDQTWPAWLQEPEVTTGTLDENTKEYKATITLTVDEEAIKDFYEEKEGFNLTFIDIDAIDVNTTIPVTHTFEAPVVITDAVITSDYGLTLTLGKDGKFKEANAASVTFTLDPGEGETDFNAYTAYSWFSEGELNGQGWGVISTQAGEFPYSGEPYLTFTATEGGYTLTAKKYPSDITIGSNSYKNAQAIIFVVPSVLYNTWMSLPNIGGIDPTRGGWWLNKGTLLNGNNPADDYKKYAIVVNVEQ